MFLEKRIRQSLNILIEGQDFTLEDTTKSLEKDNLLFNFKVKNNNSTISLIYKFNVDKRVFKDDKKELITFFQSYQKLKNKLHALQIN